MAAGDRVSIPAGARRTVADIKEIAGAHSDEEVYAMLRECNMDPNETAQRLLLQDTFHEVKRKRDKKKECSKEPADIQWRSAVHGRGGKSSRGNYYSRSSAKFSDPAGRSAIGGKEIGMNQTMGKGSGSTPTVNTYMDAKTSTSMLSSSSGLSKSASQVVDPGAAVSDAVKSGSTALVDLKGGLLSRDQVTVVGPDAHQSASTSDSILVPSLDSHNLGDFGAPGQAIGSKNTSVERNVVHDLPAENKVMSNKEWKPKLTSTTAYEETDSVIILDDIPLAADAIPQSAPMSNSVSKDDLLKVDRSFNCLQLSDKQHVIIPDHLQVSESEKYGISFGSFSASFQQSMVRADPECAESSSLPEYDSSHGIDDEPQSMQGDQNSSSMVQEEADPIPHQQSSAQLEQHSTSALENFSNPRTASDQCRDDSATSGAPRPTVVHTAPSYSTFGLAPQSHGNEIIVTEKLESQVQKPTDFSKSYSTESYQHTVDADEQMSPFVVTGAASKYGNIPVLPAQTGQDQEGNNSPVLASSGNVSVANPPAGTIPTSFAIPQQSVPVFRQSLGVHLPHFPTNYVPYNQYISPFIFPQPTIHPFLSNTAFPQPPSTGAMYPAPGSAGALPPVKYSVPSFKPGANTGSQASIGVPGAYGTYGSNPSVYNNNTTVSSGNPAENDDVSSSQFKENSIYIAGHQTEGSTLWVPAAGRDISGLQASSVYGFPPQGHQITLAAQASHVPFGGIYHPAHTVSGAAVHPLLQPSHTMAGAVEIVGAPGSVYQQPQAQMNWGNY